MMVTLKTASLSICNRSHYLLFLDEFVPKKFFKISKVKKHFALEIKSITTIHFQFCRECSPIIQSTPMTQTWYPGTMSYPLLSTMRSNKETSLLNCNSEGASEIKWTTSKSQGRISIFPLWFIFSFIQS